MTCVIPNRVQWGMIITFAERLPSASVWTIFAALKARRQPRRAFSCYDDPHHAGVRLDADS